MNSSLIFKIESPLSDKNGKTIIIKVHKIIPRIVSTMARPTVHFFQSTVQKIQFL